MTTTNWASGRARRARPGRALVTTTLVAAMATGPGAALAAPASAVGRPLPASSAVPERPTNGYLYDVAGTVVRYTPAPAGFDPLTAGPAQLARYNIPPEPAAGPARAAWAEDMSKLHFVAAPRALEAVPAHAASSVPDYSDHWAGYVDYGGPFHRVSATWSQPVLAVSRCRSGALTLWAGIGGYGTAYLAQDGTSMGTPGIGRDQAWWEITPAGMVPVPLFATPGAPFTVDVGYLGHGRFSFFMENDQTGAAWSQSESAGPGVDQSTAEVIAERPCLTSCAGTSAHYAALGNFRQVRFSSSLVDGEPIGNFPNYMENMATEASLYGRQLAVPGPLQAGATAFTVTQSHCS